jgi:hypothetical protein
MSNGHAHLRKLNAASCQAFDFLPRRADVPAEDRQHGAIERYDSAAKAVVASARQVELCGALVDGMLRDKAN